MLCFPIPRYLSAVLVWIKAYKMPLVEGSPVEHQKSWHVLTDPAFFRRSHRLPSPSLRSVRSTLGGSQQRRAVLRIPFLVLVVMAASMHDASGDEVVAGVGVNYDQNCKGPNYDYGYIGPLQYLEYPVVLSQTGPGLGVISGNTNCMEFAYEGCPAGTVLSYRNPYNDTPYCKKPVNPDLPCQGDCRDKGQGDPDFCPVGDPINQASGNLYEKQTEYTGAGPFPIRFAWTYNSTAPESTASYSSEVVLGAHRVHSFQRRLRVVQGSQSVLLLRPDGKTYVYSYANGVWASQPDVVGTLVQLKNASGATTGWQYRNRNGETETYDIDGYLITLTNKTGLSQTFTYDNKWLLKNMADAFGHELSFVYESYVDGTKRIHSMTTESGDTWKYHYDASNNLSEVIYPDDTPDVDTDNPRRQYLYEDPNFPNALTGTIDERGERVATWAYDTQGRAISFENNGGVGRVDITYNADGTSTVTNAVGRQTTYHFEMIHGVDRLTLVEGLSSANCPGASRAYSYDANGFLSSKTDWNGNLTTYERDARGLELSRTEAAGTPEARTITTEWDPDYRLPLRITEPGQITEYSYDAAGRLLSVEVKPSQ